MPPSAARLREEAEETARFAARADELRDVNAAAGRIRAAFDPVLAALPNLGVLVVLAVGVSRVLNEHAVPGDVVTVAYLLTVVSFPIRSIGWLLGEFPRSVVGYRRVESVLRASGEMAYGERGLPAADPGAWLEVDALTYSYDPEQALLSGLSFSVDPGETVVILGANGAGKTTTIRAVSGMIDTSGLIDVDGTSISGKKPEDIVRLGLAHVPQGRGTFVDLTVEENLRLGAYARKDGEIEADRDRWYEIFPRLRERRDQVAGGMSGGEQQMLAIARAAMSRPRLLLLDEPSLGLAPLVTQELFRQLQSLNQEEGMALLVVEQNANLALSIAERGYVLEAGAIVASGTAAELQADESVRQAYLGI